jgi:hypothetical protein
MFKNYNIGPRYARYDAQLSQTRARNRETEHDYVAEIKEIAPGQIQVSGP